MLVLSTSDWCKSLRRRLSRSARDNYDRLGAIKNRYEPKNLAHVNENITPI